MQLLIAFTKLACPKPNRTVAKATDKKKTTSRPPINIDPALLDLYRAIDVRG